MHDQFGEYAGTFATPRNEIMQEIARGNFVNQQKTDKEKSNERKTDCDR
jgi:hypothetical protein